MGGLFSSGSQTVTSQTQLPPQIENQVFGNIDMANQIAAGQWPSQIGQYPMYGGQRYAGMSQDEQAAGGMLRDGSMTNPNLGAATSAITAGMTPYGGTFGPSGSILQGIMSGAERTPVEFQQVIGAAANPFDQAAATAYMNPYMDAVGNEIRRQGDITNNAIRAKATAAKAFGGSRAALLESENNDSVLRNIGLQQAQAYESARNQFNTDQARALQSGSTLANLFANDAGRATQVGDLLSRLQLSTQGMQADQFNKDRAAASSGGSALAGLGETQRTGNYDLLQALMAYGGLDRGLQQQNNDFAYQQFQDARDWPLRMLQVRQSAITGQPYSQSSTSQQPTSSSATQGIGMLAALAGIGGKNGFGFWGS
ncbi:hypothetical protein E6C67_14125 [Azospirillum sp. TSA2s]|uniref:hypothetical protein n=1 Tax=Azospirillum sp. TSA2s TaxID=709810 RepID=UPI0010A998CC|nr:hypothetical protein [Azospirillum sp. TSA2s]QCG94967.1 hypothetical protein E6C67_14125 [Azospirillum sp. TSA2s]